jgi:hypothetical protein
LRAADGLIKRPAKVTDGPIVQRTDANVVTGVGRHEDRRNRVPRLDEVSVKLKLIVNETAKRRKVIRSAGVKAV